MPAEDDFNSKLTQLNSPLNGGFEITPNDSEDLSTITRAFMVKTGGDVMVELRNGNVVTIPETMPGAVYWHRIKRVLVAGTEATGIVGFF